MQKTFVSTLREISNPNSIFAFALHQYNSRKVFHSASKILAGPQESKPLPKADKVSVNIQAQKPDLIPLLRIFS